jgi:photosynthetic reaction center cytochrome c subunit
MRRRFILILTVTAIVWRFGSELAAPQSAGQQTPSASERVFRNIQVLKGIPVDDFMGTMGVMCAALGFDCSECHAGAGTEKVDWAADTPKKIRARQMVLMVASINRQNFAGQQLVTCWSCHHGRDHPATAPALENVYGPASQEMDVVLTQVPGQPAADQILGEYLQAVGGTARLSALKTYSARGFSVGFGGFGGRGRVQIFARFPDQRATIIDFPDSPSRGDSVRIYNGSNGWLRMPLTILSEYQLTGAELDGTRLDAQLTFPGQIRQILTSLHVSLPVTISDLPGPTSQALNQANMAAVGQDRLVNVVQGTTPGGTLATLYFDQESHLLVRVVRYAKSPIGRVPTQIDYGDYRDVNGIKMPFRILIAWLGGRDAIQLSEVQTNVPIDAGRFARPAPSKGQ